MFLSNDLFLLYILLLLYTFNKQLRNGYRMINSTKRWYALYTKSRAEKKVARLLEEAGVELYLPLQKTLKQWSDRRKMVYEPLFRSYIFVHVSNRDFGKPLKIPGVVHYVTFAKERIPVPDCQIAAIRTYLGEIELKEPLEYFKLGNEVEVVFGPLRGLHGRLIRVRNHRKLIVQIDAVHQDITLTLPSHLLKKTVRLSS